MSTEPDVAGAAESAPTDTMYLDQSAHLDWDWIQTFEEYYETAYDGNGVKGVLGAALDNLKALNPGGHRGYYYSICEMGFLRRFVEDSGRGREILAAGDHFQVLGGGITSPDCLVCSGEGFIRNYLVGRGWLARELPGLEAKPHCIIPDDFGQGPELPVLLAALGFTGVGFSRLPGTWDPDATDPREQLLTGGVDFVWRASDGSRVVAHWMFSPDDNKGPYGWANQNDDGTKKPRPIADLVTLYNSSKRTAATPFMYFPIENDFSMPVEGLLDVIDEWNQGDSDVFVRAGTFADFMEQVLPLQDQLQVLGPYNGTPYWTGYYASRPELKILHYETLRTLVEAEVFGMLAPDEVPFGFWSDVATTWESFAPSTHHDYVCGTACDRVYADEQLPLLGRAATNAAACRNAALAALAGKAAPTGAKPVVVANGLGFARIDLAELPKGAAGDSPDLSGGANASVQPSFEGGTLFMASVPSLGFEAVDVALAANGAQTAPASIDPESSGAAVYVLVNEFMRVTISQEANWGIEHLVHAETEDQVLAGPGNDLVFYGDGGGLYRFGNENGNSFSADTGVTVKPLGAEVLEAGPLRVRLRTEVTATPPNGGTPINFTREYALVAGEPFLRMSTTGAAFPADYDPPGYSVMTRFPLASPVARISHGTGCHWTDVQPRGVDDGYWGPPVFRATHDFLVPEDASGDALAAVYHGGMPAWAFDENGALIGCLLRNTPQSSYGAGGSDTAQHTQLYALRVPAGLAPPETGRPLQEARRFNTPLRVAAVPAGAGGSASSGSLAAVSEPAIITVAKPGSFDPASLILRLYQPSNRTATVQVTLGSPPSAARVVNALEGEWHGPATPLTPDEFGFSLKMPAALATVQVDGPA